MQAVPMRKSSFFFPFLLLAFFAQLPSGSADALRTVAEQSGYARTGRYDEVARLCGEFARAFPGRARCSRFGTTAAGRPLFALAASNDGVLDPSAVLRQQRKVVLLQGGIHAGEIDGKDAGFAVLRRLLERRDPRLERLTLVFVPVLNADGHERFGPHQRPNQAGPAEGGWRVTAQNLNLNRDYVKAESPEMAALLALLRSWDPLLYVDLHVTDGAQFQVEVALQIEPRLGGPAVMRSAGERLSREVQRRLAERGRKAVDFYPSFLKTDDPSSGFAADLPPPRFSHGYWPLWNRYACLVEAHSWQPYARRVQITADAIEVLLDGVVADLSALGAAAAAADQADLQLAGAEVALDHDAAGPPVRIRFPGYAYSIEPSPISGALRIKYDPSRKELWDVPFLPRVEVKAKVAAPAAYLIPPEHAELVRRKLELHGLRYAVIPDGPGLAAVEGAAWRASEKRFRERPYEGRQLVEARGSWTPEPAAPRPGGLLIPVGQRGGRLVVHLLEPGAPDSLLSWGFFNVIFEDREYMEAYVTEQIAEQQLARDPSLRIEFAARLRSDPAFAHDAAARLRFFYKRHPAFDAQLDRYPILRVSRLPALPSPAAPKVASQPGPRAL
jgi:hypothetical protein